MTTRVIDQLNNANPNTLADLLRSVGIGTLIAQLPQSLRKKLPVADAGANVSTVQTIVLPNDQKASNIIGAYARTGTAGTGPLTIVATGTTPTSGQIAIQSNGDLMVLAADALLDVDVEYQPSRTDIVVLVGLPVVSNVLAIPAALVARGISKIVDVNTTTATNIGRKRVLAPGSGTPATGACRLDVAKAIITFAAGDAATVADVTLAVSSALDLTALLQSQSTLQ